MMAFVMGRRDVRGAATITLIVILCLVLIAAGAGWWFFNKRTPTPTPTPVQTQAQAPAQAQVAKPVPDASPPEEAAPPVSVPDMTVDELYTAARKALTDNRMVAPAGDNALEFYLKIQKLQPDNAGAADALRELFPFAVGAAETEIDKGAYNDATRIIDLLAEADPSNYSLTILRGKLDAKKKQTEREELAAAKPPPPPPEPLQTPEAAPQPQPSPAPTPPPRPAVAATTPPPVAPAPPAPPTGETRDAQAISPLAPVYPPAAARARQEGWVEVEFTVAADGSIRNPHVINAQPPRVFDSAAVRAAQAAKFQPKLVNGQPADAVVRRRIEFKLNR